MLKIDIGKLLTRWTWRQFVIVLFHHYRLFSNMKYTGRNRSPEWSLLAACQWSQNLALRIDSEQSRTPRRNKYWESPNAEIFKTPWMNLRFATVADSLTLQLWQFDFQKNACLEKCDTKVRHCINCINSRFLKCALEFYDAHDIFWPRIQFDGQINCYHHYPWHDKRQCTCMIFVRIF